MSKRAEEAALETYPVQLIRTNFDTHEFDENIQAREVYIQGYEQAEKETIERAAKWLEENVWESTGLDFQILTESFKNAIK